MLISVFALNKMSLGYNALWILAPVNHINKVILQNTIFNLFYIWDGLFIREKKNVTARKVNENSILWLYHGTVQGRETQNTDLK